MAQFPPFSFCAGPPPLPIRDSGTAAYRTHARATASLTGISIGVQVKINARSMTFAALAVARAVAFFAKHTIAIRLNHNAHWTAV